MRARRLDETILYLVPSCSRVFSVCFRVVLPFSRTLVPIRFFLSVSTVRTMFARLVPRSAAVSDGFRRYYSSYSFVPVAFVIVSSMYMYEEFVYRSSSNRSYSCFLFFCILFSFLASRCLFSSFFCCSTFEIRLRVAHENVTYTLDFLSYFLSAFRESCMN